MSITGNLPEIPSLDLERLTGSGSSLNVDGNRQSAADRAIERLNGMDAQKLRQDATEEISGKIKRNGSITPVLGELIEHIKNNKYSLI